MIINTTNIQRILIAEPGKYLTDKEDFCSSVFLPIGADYSNWIEITAEEKERMEAELNVLFE